MSLGTPSIGTSSAWYSQYETDITQLLQRLQDNTSNLIDAKDVRDSIWTLYNQILLSASQSATQSLYDLGTPSTVTVGGIIKGSTFSQASLKDLFDQMLLPYVAPTIDQFQLSSQLYQFGQVAPLLTASYSITPGSVPLFSIQLFGPSGLLSTNIPTGSDPETGVFGAIVPTYSTTPTLVGSNTFTMSVVTTDSLSFSQAASIDYNHKIYYGPIDLTPIGGFTASDPISVSTVESYLTDTRIKGLSYSDLTTGFTFDQDMVFATGSYFVFAHPTLFGELPYQGFYVENMFTTDHTKIRDASTFSNEYSYLTQYDVWISNASYDNVDINIRHDG